MKAKPTIYKSCRRRIDPGNLDALSARFNLTYNSAPNGRALTGLYSGSLTEVLARVLAGNDYVLGVLDDRVRIVVVNASTAEAPAVQVVASNDTQVAQLPGGHCRGAAIRPVQSDPAAY